MAKRNEMLETTTAVNILCAENNQSPHFVTSTPHFSVKPLLQTTTRFQPPWQQQKARFHGYRCLDHALGNPVATPSETVSSDSASPLLPATSPSWPPAPNNPTFSCHGGPFLLLGCAHIHKLGAVSGVFMSIAVLQARDASR